MKIKLSDRYYLNSDEYCYWITIEIKTKGKPVFRRVSGYCSTFQEAVDTFIEKGIRSSDAESVAELTKEVNKIKREVHSWKAILK